jgi:hypothetical protein
MSKYNSLIASKRGSFSSINVVATLVTWRPERNIVIEIAKPKLSMNRYASNILTLGCTSNSLMVVARDKRESNQSRHLVTGIYRARFSKLSLIRVDDY